MMAVELLFLTLFFCFVFIAKRLIDAEYEYRALKEKAAEKAKKEAEKEAAAIRRRRRNQIEAFKAVKRKQIEALKATEEESLAKEAEARAVESKKLDAFTPQAYLEKLIPDLDHSDSEIRLNTVYKMGVENTPRTFANSYYAQFPLYYLEQKVKELGLQAGDKDKKAAATLEDVKTKRLIDSTVAVDPALAEEMKKAVEKAKIVERLEKAKWRFRTKSINDVEDAENSPENLRKFMNNDDPALRKMGLSMAKGADLIIGLDDLKKEINEELAGKLRDKNRRVRGAVAIALGAIGDSRAIPGLQEASKHVRRDVEKSSPHLSHHAIQEWKDAVVKRNFRQGRSRMIAEREELIMDLLEKIEEENWVP